MGESEDDRLRLLVELANLEKMPESVPINCLTPIDGTPMQDAEPVDAIELVRLIATARIGFPKARGAIERRSRPHEPGVAGALLHGGGEFHLLRRQAADGAESSRGRRRPNVPRDGIAGALRERAMNLFDRWQADLKQLREQGRYRSLTQPAGIDFSSNDYLGYSKRNLRAGSVSDGFPRSGGASRSCAATIRSGTKLNPNWRPGIAPKPP